MDEPIVIHTAADKWGSIADRLLREDHRVPDLADPTAPPLRRIFPEPPTDVTIAEAYADDDRHRLGDRPWVMATMIASIDGAAAVDGRSRPLGNPTDTAVLSMTRSLADVVVVGAGTVRAERYGAPRTPGLRIGVVSRTGDLDVTSALFTSGAGFLIVPDDAPATNVPTVRAGTGSVDIAHALTRLHEVVGTVDVVQCEGGPTLNAALSDAGCLDELNLTLSPQLAGGDATRLVHGARPQPIALRLATLLVDADGFVFSRWRRR